MSEFNRVGVFTFEDGDTFSIYRNDDEERNNYLIVNADGTITQAGRLGVFMILMNEAQSREQDPYRQIGESHQTVEDTVYVPNYVVSEPMRESSLIALATHDNRERVLTVTLKNAGVKVRYEYHNVPRQVFWDLIHAESPGRYYVHNIKGRYNSEGPESPIDYGIYAQ